MQRYMPGALPRQGAGTPNQQDAELRPLAGAERLCEYIRAEHGRAGVKRFLGALSPFVPRDFLEQLSRRTGAELPPAGEAREKAPPQPAAPAVKPEQLLKLMNLSGGGGGGMDPATLIKLMGEMGR